MYFATSLITLFLLPFALADHNSLRRALKQRLLAEPTLSMHDFKKSFMGGPTKRQADPCDPEFDTVISCLGGIPSSAEICVDCVLETLPDEGDTVYCSDFLDIACGVGSSCSSCGRCSDEFTDWLICLHDNGGCQDGSCSSF